MKEGILCFFLLITVSLQAQQKNPAGGGIASDIGKAQPAQQGATIEQKLVALALQNAEVKIADLQVASAKAQVGVAKAGWLNSININGNINEYSINPPPDQLTNIYYPKYNFGISIPLGFFITNSNSVRISKRSLDISKETRELRIQEIKTEVLSRYEDYQMYKQQMTLQNEVVENSYNSYLQAQTKFQSGEIPIDDFNKALQSYNTEMSSKIALQRNLAVAKLEVEKIIKVPLETVLQSQ